LHDQERQGCRLTALLKPPTTSNANEVNHERDPAG
jgi:hypothetical protein